MQVVGIKQIAHGRPGADGGIKLGLIGHARSGGQKLAPPMVPHIEGTRRFGCTHQPTNVGNNLVGGHGVGPVDELTVRKFHAGHSLLLRMGIPQPQHHPAWGVRQFFGDMSLQAGCCRTNMPVGHHQANRQRRVAANPILGGDGQVIVPAAGNLGHHIAPLPTCGIHHHRTLRPLPCFVDFHQLVVHGCSKVGARQIASNDASQTVGHGIGSCPPEFNRNLGQKICRSIAHF